MASAALRRAASAAAPLALRTLRRSHLCHASGGSALLRPLSLGAAPRLPSSGFSFSSSAVAPKAPSDKDLVRVIDSEIKCAEECDDHDRAEEVPQGFPFEIEDKKGMGVVFLRRKYEGEDIEVVVSMPSLVTGEEPDDNREEDDNEGNDGQGDGNANQSSLPLTVSVSKGDGPSLEFACTAYPDEVVIDSLSVKEKKGDSDDEMLAYEGPDFNDLDENLQKAFHKYLEIRGVSAMTTNFLHEYMINKDGREYLIWLKNLKHFIQN